MSPPLPQWTMSLTKEEEVRARRFVFLRGQAYTDIACLTKRITSFDTFFFFFFHRVFIFPVEEKLVRSILRDSCRKMSRLIEVD